MKSHCFLLLPKKTFPKMKMKKKTNSSKQMDHSLSGSKIKNKKSLLDLTLHLKKYIYLKSNKHISLIFGLCMNTSNDRPGRMYSNLLRKLGPDQITLYVISMHHHHFMCQFIWFWPKTWSGLVRTPVYILPGMNDHKNPYTSKQLFHTSY